MKTKVQFLVHQNNGELPDLFAFFPDEFYNKHGDETLRQSYSHVGQHSACSIEYAKESRPATESEYMPLKTELESIGYKLKVCN